MNEGSLNCGLLALLSSMYLCKPTRESLGNWRQLLADEHLRGSEGLQAALCAIDLDSEPEIEDILWDYTRLFIGPHRLPCPPLESVYTSPKRLMMQEAHAQVQRFYARIGIEIGSAEVMADHIGAELNFVVVLFNMMETEPEKTELYAALIGEFWEAHLRNWVPRFAADMEEAAETPLYQSLAKITREAIALGC